MIFPDDIPVHGDTNYRGKCPKEHVELASFFSRLRREYPSTYGAIALHPRNEQSLQNAQFSSVLQHKAEGLTPGASDIIIPARTPFVCEMKRCDHTQSDWKKGQREYLRAVIACGGYGCVALGAVAAWSAFQSWLTTQTAVMSNS